MKKLGNMIKQEAIHETNYTVLSNEILFNKDLSFEAKALFWQIWSLNANEWNLSIRGLQTLTGWSYNTVRKNLDELIKIGYIKRVDNLSKGKFGDFTYYLFETLDETLWKNENLRDANFESPNDSRDANFAYALNEQLPDANFAYAKNEPNKILYNINNYNNIKYYNNKNLDLKNQDTFPQKNLNNNKNNTLLIKKQNNLPEQNSLEKNNQKDLTTQKVEDGAQPIIKQKKIKNKEQLHKMETPETNVANLIENRKIADNTPEENVLAQVIKIQNEIKEDKEIILENSQKRQHRKTRVKNKLDSEIGDLELNELLTNYFHSWIESGRKMTDQIYEAQLKKLSELSSNMEDKKKIVKRSLEKGWLDLYPLNSDKNNMIKPQVVIHNEEDYDEGEELATDEFGNLLKF